MVPPKVFSLRSRYKWRNITTIYVSVFAASLETGIFLPQVVAGTGVILFLYSFWHQRLDRPLFHPVIYGVIAAMLVQLLSAILSDYPMHSLSTVARYYLLPLVGLISVLLLGRHPRVLKYGMQTILIAGVIASLYALFQHLTGLDPIYHQEIRGPINEIQVLDLYAPRGLLNTTLTFAGVQMMILLLWLPAAWNSRGKRARWIWIAMAIILMSLIILYKRSPWIGAFVGTSIFFISLGRKAAIRYLLIGIAAVIVFALVSEGFRTRVVNSIQLKTESEQDRIYLWQAAWDLGKDYPVLGIGPGNWPKFRDDYLPEHEYYSIAHAHSDPLHMWATTGLLGVVTVSVVLILLIWHGIKDLRRTKVVSFSRDIYRGMILAICGFFAASLFQCYLLDGEDALTLGFIIGLGLAARERLLRRYSISVTGHL